MLFNKLQSNITEIVICIGLGSGVIGWRFDFWIGIATGLLCWAICLSILTTIRGA